MTRAHIRSEIAAIVERWYQDDSRSVSVFDVNGLLTDLTDYCRYRTSAMQAAAQLDEHESLIRRMVSLQ